MRLRRTSPCLRHCARRRGLRRRAIRCAASLLPEAQELPPVRLGALFQGSPDEIELGLVALRGVGAAHELEAEIEEIGIDRVGLAIVADGLDCAVLVALP